MEKSNRTIQDYLSLGYLFLILCGLAKDIIFYGYLGINILNYSSISDVLLSPIIYLGENIIAVGFFIFLPVFMYFTHNKLANFHHKHKDKKWYNMGMDLSNWNEYLSNPPSFERALPLLAVAFLSFFLGTGLGEGPKTKAILATNDYEVNRKILFQDKESVAVRLIGQNSQYVFYVLPDDPTIQIAPIQGNIKRIALIVPSEKIEK